MHLQLTVSETRLIGQDLQNYKVNILMKESQLQHKWAELFDTEELLLTEKKK